MRCITWYFLGLSGFVFCRKLALTKNQQYTNKSRERSGCIIFCAYRQVDSPSYSNLLNSLHFNSSQFAPNSLFAYFTDRVQHPVNTTVIQKFKTASLSPADDTYPTATFPLLLTSPMTTALQGVHPL